MTFKSFVVNYLNPFYLLWRGILLLYSLYLLIFLMGHSGGMTVNAFLGSLGGGVALTVLLILLLTNRRWFLLYVAAPVAFTGLAWRYGEGSWLAALLGVVAALLVAWNGVRPWESGPSLHDIQSRLDELNKHK